MTGIAIAVVVLLLVATLPVATASHTSDADNDWDSDRLWPVPDLYASVSTDCGIWHQSDGTWDYRTDADATVDADEAAEDPLFYDWRVYANTVLFVPDTDEKTGTDMPPYHEEAHSLQTADDSNQELSWVSSSAEAEHEDARTGGLLVRVQADTYSFCRV